MSERGVSAVVFGVSANDFIAAVVAHCAGAGAVLGLGDGGLVVDHGGGDVSLVRVAGFDGDPAHVVVEASENGLPLTLLSERLGCAAYVVVVNTGIGLDVRRFVDRGAVLVEEGADPNRERFFECPLLPIAAFDEPSEAQLVLLRAAADAALREQCAWGAALIAARDRTLLGSPVVAAGRDADDDIPF